ncbi:4Fe-4S dicluster domain-containing protein [bacterium]|nr:4Fe-4S dicluster domain-containing protein [bacterium]
MGLVNLRKIRRAKQEIGGREVAVVISPRPEQTRLGTTVWQTFKSLLTGMKITISYLFRPSTVVTQQYPENRETLQMFDRYRAQLKLVYDEAGGRLCNCCQICENACPNQSIKIEWTKNPDTKKKELERWIWRMDSCTFCNACVQACPSNSITFGNEFESAVYDRRLLVYTLNDKAGPDAKVWSAIEDPAEREKLMRKMDRYSGPIPLSGTSLPGNPSGKEG